QRTYGFFEAKINFDDSPGEWCAFWLQSPTIGKPVENPESAGVEIDISEHRALNYSGQSIADESAMGALHWDGYGVSEKDIWSTLVAPADGSSVQGRFHTYGVL